MRLEGRVYMKDLWRDVIEIYRLHGENAIGRKEVRPVSSEEDTGVTPRVSYECSFPCLEPRLSPK